MPAYAVVLDKVPGLSLHAKASIRKFVADKKLGKHNYPRTFSNEEFAAQGIVSGVHNILDNRVTFFFLCFSGPPRICTVKGNEVYSDSETSFL